MICKKRWEHSLDSVVCWLCAGAGNGLGLGLGLGMDMGMGWVGAWSERDLSVWSVLPVGCVSLSGRSVIELAVQTFDKLMNCNAQVATV